MEVGEIWRYPVKSMRGERVSETEVLRSGLEGDRRIVVVSVEGERLITARTHPGLLGLQASLEQAGGVTIEGLPWDSREAREWASDAAGEAVGLFDLSTNPERFDVLPLLVATDGAVAELGIDRRRLRPNIVVFGAPGRTEREWPGRCLQMGPVVIEAAQLRGRCVMTTFDPDSLVQDRSVLTRIVSEMQGRVALDCSVRTPGRLREKDSVRLIAE